MMLPMNVYSIYKSEPVENHFSVFTHSELSNKYPLDPITQILKRLGLSATF